MNELNLDDGLKFRVEGNLSSSYKGDFGHGKKISSLKKFMNCI
jgi:hypothetical protein